MSDMVPYTPNGMLEKRTDSWTAVLEQVAVLATRIADTELVPAALRRKPAAVAAVILYGREIGLPPMTALRSSYVVNGRVAVAAETMRGLILAAGHEIRVEGTTARAVARGRRKGQEEWTEVVWTLDLARHLQANPSWRNYPRQMLKARATAELARDLFADVIGGFEAVEELDEVAEAPDTTPRRTVAQRARTEPARTEQEPAPNVEAEGQDTLPEVTARRPTTPQPRPVQDVPLPGEDGYDQIGQPQPEPEPEPARRDTDTWAMAKNQRDAMHAAFNALGITDRALRLAITSRIIPRPITTSADLTRGEYRALMDTLERIRASGDMSAEVQRIVNAERPVDELDQLFLPPAEQNEQQ